MHSLYKSLSVNITKIFISKGIISKEQKAAYEYSFEILISTFVYAILFLLTSILTKTLSESLVFWFSFSVLRSIAGGYHADTHLICNMLTMLCHISFICFLYFIPDLAMFIIITVSLLISSVIVLFFAPIDHPNKPFIKTEKKRFRILSCIYAFVIILVAVSTIIFYSANYANYLFGYSFGTLVATISLVAAKINYKKGKHNEKA